MTDLEKAARLALEALERCVATCFDRYAHEQVMSRPEHFVNQAIITIKEALAEQPAQQKSVGYVYSVHGERIKNACIESDVPNGTPVYILPQRKQWVGLTDVEIARVVSLAGFAPDWAEANIATQIVRVCQDMLKEKNA